MADNIYLKTDIPLFKNERVFIPFHEQFPPIKAMFAEAGFQHAKSLKEATLVVYGGGADVDPVLYGQYPIKECGAPNKERDEIEMDIFLEALELELPQLGICRGAQFLNVVCGGELWQHVNNHTQSHFMTDTSSGEKVFVSSTHHQMMKWNDRMRVIGVCEDPVATLFKDDNETMVGPSPQPEVEVCAYDADNILCVQGHPEYGPLPFTSWFFHLVKEWLDLR